MSRTPNRGARAGRGSTDQREALATHGGRFSERRGRNSLPEAGKVFPDWKRSRNWTRHVVIKLSFEETGGFGLMGSRLPPTAPPTGSAWCPRQQEGGSGAPKPPSPRSRGRSPLVDQREALAGHGFPDPDTTRGVPILFRVRWPSAKWLTWDRPMRVSRWIYHLGSRPIRPRDWAILVEKMSSTSQRMAHGAVAFACRRREPRSIDFYPSASIRSDSPGRAQIAH